MGIDTYRFVKDITSEGLPESIAVVISQKFMEAENVNSEKFSTKSDLQELGLKFDSKLAELKADLVRWLLGAAIAICGIIIAAIKTLSS